MSSPSLFFLSEKFQLWKTEAFYRIYNILKQFLAEGHLSLRLEFLLRGNRRETEPSQNLAAHRSGHAQADGEQQHVDLTTHTHTKKKSNVGIFLQFHPPSHATGTTAAANWAIWKSQRGKPRSLERWCYMLRWCYTLSYIHVEYQPIVTPATNLICFFFACNSTLGPCSLGSSLLPITAHIHSWGKPSYISSALPALGSLDNSYFRLIK